MTQEGDPRHCEFCRLRSKGLDPDLPGHLKGNGRIFGPLPEDNGGGDMSRVRLDQRGKPRCTLHGSMNKVSPDGIWRCIPLSGAKLNPCRSGCIEVTI